MKESQIEYIRYGKGIFPRPFWIALILLLVCGLIFKIVNLVELVVNVKNEYKF